MQQSKPSSFGILDLVQGAEEVCAVPAGERDVGEWMDVIGEVSAAMTVLAAARDAAIVRLAAIEEVVTEDGVIGEQVNGLGTVSVDAGAMVSTATGTSTRFGAELVGQAITRVVRVPGLHAAMLSGVLDDYKARCIAAELSEVPPELARTVVDALSPEMGERSGPSLRRRTRDILFKLAPELLRERIRKARSTVGLQRWLGEPGTDSWGAVFPSERAATTWAAIDALARRYKAEDRYPTLEQARAYALLDLVDGRTTVQTVLHLTVPADALDEAAGESASPADQTAGSKSETSEPETSESETSESETSEQGTSEPQTSEPESGAGVPVSTQTQPPVVGPQQPPDVGPQQPPDVGPEQPPAAGPRADSAGSARSADGAGEMFVATSTARGSEVSWMPLSMLAGRVVDGVVRVCHVGTGSLVDPGNALGSEAYRPGTALKQLIRQRDGRCRFPGCAIAARQCDLDHVTAWPGGPTAAVNLICLCRRHHRVKQRHRWRVRLLPDGVVEWIDPAGRRIRTEPVDHLRAGHVRVARVEPATPQDIADLLEWERFAAQFDETDGVDEADSDAASDGVDGTGLDGADLDGTGLGVTGLGVTGLDVTGLDVTGLDVTDLDATGRDATGRDATGLGVTGLGVTGLGVTGLGVTGLGVTGLDVTGLDATGRDATGRNATGAGPVPPAAAADSSELEAALRRVVTVVVDEVLRTRSQDSSEAANGRHRQSSGSSGSGGCAATPTRTPKAWSRKRFGTHTLDLDRIPRPQRQGYHGVGSDIAFPPPSAEQGGRDEPASSCTVDCRFEAGLPPEIAGVRYRASRRHRRRAAYLAAGGPPF